MRTKTLALMLIFLTTASMPEVLLPVRGATWGSPVPLPGADPYSNTFSAMLTTSWGDAWLVWEKVSTSTTAGDIYLMTHNRYGWSGQTPLVTNTGDDITPALAQLPNGTIILVWSCNCTTNYYLYTKSYNAVTGWSAQASLVQGPGNNFGPALTTLADGRLMLAWTRTVGASDGFGDVYYKLYNGTWGTEQLLVGGPQEEGMPTLFQAADGKVWAVFEANYNVHAQLWYKTWTGTTWSGTLQFTSDVNNDRWPSMTMDRSGALWVFWARRLAASPWQWDLFYKTSTDNGATWSSDTSVASDPANDQNPSIIQGPDKTLWVLWSSTRALGNPYGTPNLYLFQSSAIPGHDLAITGLQTSPPTPRVGETLSISATVANIGDYPETSTVRIYLNSIQVGSLGVSLSPGQAVIENFTWNSSGKLYGIYNVQASVDNVTQEVVKWNNNLSSSFPLVPLGDVNRDRTVNVLDLALVSVIFGTRIGNPGYIRDRDLNKDGIINVTDIVLVAIDFGKTV